MYDKNYYDDLKRELESDFQVLQLKGFQKFLNLASELNGDVASIQKKYQALAEKEKVAQEESKPKAEIEPKKEDKKK